EAGTAKRNCFSEGATGAACICPDRMASRVAQHATEAARGPMESRLKDSGNAPACGTRRAVGLKPTRPQNAEGIRTEPPVSVPMAATDIRSATETPAPEDDPPGIRPVARSQGLLGVP